MTSSEHESQSSGKDLPFGYLGPAEETPPTETPRSGARRQRERPRSGGRRASADTESVDTRSTRDPEDATEDTPRGRGRSRDPRRPEGEGERSATPRRRKERPDGATGSAAHGVDDVPRFRNAPAPPEAPEPATEPDVEPESRESRPLPPPTEEFGPDGRVVGWKGFRLSRFQLQAVDAIRNGRNVLVSAPTGAGKTLVAEYAIEDAVQPRAQRCIYTAPIKALSNQKYRDFQRRPRRSTSGS